MHNLKISSEAKVDITQASEWYELQRLGLGIEFLLCVEAALDAIRENPYRYPVARKNTRRAVVRRFPYSVYFIVETDSITVTAVFHGHRNPRVWRRRS